MKNSKEALQKICAVILSHYKDVKDAYEAYDSFECAIKKYGTTPNKIALDIAGDVDYEKIIWQIITDLRFARNLDLDYDEQAAGYDSYYLSEIASIVREVTGEDKIIETSAINQNEYLEIVRKMGLI